MATSSPAEQGEKAAPTPSTVNTGSPHLALPQHPRGRATLSLGLGWWVTQPALPQATSPQSILEKRDEGRTGESNEDEHLVVMGALTGA